MTLFLCQEALWRRASLSLVLLLLQNLLLKNLVTMQAIIAFLVPKLQGKDANSCSENGCYQNQKYGSLVENSFL